MEEKGEGFVLRVSVGSKCAVAAVTKSRINVTENLFIKSKMSTDDFRDEAT